MASLRRLLAFAGAACLSLAGHSQQPGISLPALQSQSNVRRFFDIRSAAFAGPIERIAKQAALKVAGSAALIQQPAAREGRRPAALPTGTVLIGGAVLLVQSALILLLILQMRERRRLDQIVRRLTARLIHAGEQERSHLARELHDDIGQRLSLVSMELDSLSRSPAAGSGDEDRTLRRIVEELQTVISDVHGLSHRLHSTRLEHLGLQDALKELCRHIAERYDLQLDLQMNKIEAELDRDVSLCFYRVAQEALCNIVRHSSSSKAAVRLAMSRAMLSLQVADNGVGFDPLKKPAGLGMVTMEERLRTVGGRLEVNSQPGAGTVVTALVSLALPGRQKRKEAKRHA
jgi:signal transduction histidine kinase